MSEISTPRFDTWRDRAAVALTVGGLAIGVPAMFKVLNHTGGDCDAQLASPASWVACPIIDTGRAINRNSFNGVSNMMQESPGQGDGQNGQ